MDDYRKPIKVNRYWNRPKPRVYECNMRDVERMYQDSYKEYKAEKEYKLRGWQSDSLSDRFAHLRAGPLRREQSAQPYSSRFGESSSHLGRSNSVSKDASETTTTFRSEAKNSAYDAQRDNQSLEERLERLKKLREDLGLPSDTETSKNTLRESASRTFANDTDSSYKSERTSRISSRTRAAAAANDDSSSYSYKSERSARVNGIGNSSSDDYKYKSERATDEFKLPPRRDRKTEDFTPKTERKTFSSKADSLNHDISFGRSEKKVERYSKLSTTAASSSSPIRSRKAAAAAPVSESLDFDDDDFDVAKMMKKLPSSQEILDRISKMELDD